MCQVKAAGKIAIVYIVAAIFDAILFIINLSKEKR